MTGAKSTARAANRPSCSHAGDYKRLVRVRGRSMRKAEELKAVQIDVRGLLKAQHHPIEAPERLPDGRPQLSGKAARKAALYGYDPETL